MNIEFTEFVKKNLYNYDESNIKYDSYISSKDIEYIETTDESSLIYNKKDKYYKSVLGIFDNETKIWVWGWAIPKLKTFQNEIIRKLLIYGLDIDLMEKNDAIFYYVKTNLINSRFKVKNNIQLDILLSMSKKILKNKCKFIQPKKIQLTATKEITIYYTIYDIE
jgi:hypothetical protein